MTPKTALASTLIFLVRMYQRYVSPFRPPSCRFYPSCSSYGVTALARFGAFKGGWLAIRRLGRCHPWTPGGVDEVPSTWERRHERPEFVPPVFDKEPGVSPRASRHHHEHTT